MKNWIHEFIKLQFEKYVPLAAFVVMATFLACSNVGCIDNGGSSPAQSRVADPISDETPTVPTPTPTATIQLTYYALTMTEAPVNGWPTRTYTATGSCVVYLTKTYCWDDGIKTLHWVYNNSEYGPYRYTYWRRTASNGSCHGGCTTDLFLTPRFISVTLNNTLSANISAVFSSGVAKTVSCVESSTTVSCGDFVIDLTQTPI